MVRDRVSQALADQCAQQHGYFATVYWGKFGDECVYEPYHSDTLDHDKGITFIVVKDGQAELVQDEKRAYDIFHDILNRGNVDIVTRGKNAFNRFMGKYGQGKLSEADEQYAKQLLEMIPKEVKGQIIEPKVDLRLFCIYFEMAERFHKHLALFPDEKDEPVWNLQIVD
jgi:hypothetical protein